ncbi:Type IV fimbrial biogenesis protein PilW [Myxococcus hansupus]|uniref:Type IV fimbrial biogenesis protein PilW n=1 Tax=Pseudomyxococcus hansupus TaxID=1297742 RepID=A0A0H4X5B9_9BACT|nr:prepilin-type N-terminal cleavage/methylation domain-containing protein [Myxococcus hansupus]AKQ69038.1 Type IV fimbrial biogenesis protein PilW [Myxococcus hansupus]
MNRPHPTPPRGFTLIELMVASTLSMLVLAAAIGVSVHLQRRGLMEERIMETQNTGRAARDLLAFSVQRAGAGIGSLSLTGGQLPAGTADVFYAVSVRTRAEFPGDPSFVPPLDGNLLSDALDVWETDPGRMVLLTGCGSGGGGPAWADTRLCISELLRPPPAFLDNAVIAVVRPGSNTSRGWACIGQVTSRVAEGVEWTPGIPGRPSPGDGNCHPNAAVAGGVWNATETNPIYLLPVSSRSFRVNWPEGRPTLEMDVDGPSGPAAYGPVSQDIEQLQIRLGVVDPGAPMNGAVRFFPDPGMNRPALETCTQGTCAAHVTWTWDPGVPVPPDRGPGSAGDELMRRVRLVELSITARSQRVELLGDEAGGGIDDWGNPQDGFKRRHTVVRLAPRNFAFVGVEGE